MLGVVGPSVHIAKKLQGRLKHFGHGIHSKHVHNQRRLYPINGFCFQELPCLKAQSWVVITDDTEDVNLLDVIRQYDLAPISGHEPASLLDQAFSASGTLVIGNLYRLLEVAANNLIISLSRLKREAL